MPKVCVKALSSLTENMGFVNSSSVRCQGEVGNKDVLVDVASQLQRDVQESSGLWAFFGEQKAVQWRTANRSIALADWQQAAAL